MRNSVGSGLCMAGEEEGGLSKKGGRKRLDEWVGEEEGLLVGKIKTPSITLWGSSSHPAPEDPPRGAIRVVPGQGVITAPQGDNCASELPNQVRQRGPHSLRY